MSFTLGQLVKTKEIRFASGEIQYPEKIGAIVRMEDDRVFVKGINTKTKQMELSICSYNQIQNMEVMNKIIGREILDSNNHVGGKVESFTGDTFITEEGRFGDLLWIEMKLDSGDEIMLSHVSILDLLQGRDAGASGYHFISLGESSKEDNICTYDEFVDWEYQGQTFGAAMDEYPCIDKARRYARWSYNRYLLGETIQEIFDY
jgi:hypothetical protein